MKKITLLFTILVFIIGCRSLKIKDKEESQLDIQTITTEKLVQKLISNRISYSSFSTRFKIEIRTSTLDQPARGTIKIIKDSAIYGNITDPFIGIELIRALITPDTFKALDRINKKNILQSISKLKSTFGLPLTFTDLSDLFVGNPLLDSFNFQKIVRDSFQVSIIGSKNQYQQTITVDTSLNISHVTLLDTLTLQQIDIEYSDYSLEENHLVPTKRTFNIQTDDKMVAELEYFRIKFDQPEKFKFRFNPRFDTIK